MEKTVGPVSTHRRELLRGWRQLIGLMVSFMVFTASVQNILEATTYIITLQILHYEIICLLILGGVSLRIRITERSVVLVSMWVRSSSSNWQIATLLIKEFQQGLRMCLKGDDYNNSYTTFVTSCTREEHTFTPACIPSTTI
jgi:hypothetical protein